jgi:hypothetical protein
MADVTVGELREMLELYDDDTPIRLGTQPSYPLQAHIQADIRTYKGVAYLLEAGQVYDAPYLPKWLLNGGEPPCVACESTRNPLVADITHDGETNPVCRDCFDQLTPEDYAEITVEMR